MLHSQKIQLRMSETREAANAATDTAEHDKHRAALVTMETEYRTALEAEDKERQGANLDDALTAEVLDLAKRARATAIVSAIASHRLTDGAEAELQAALRVGGDTVPWALLEARAAATFTGSTGPASHGALCRQGLR